MSHAHILVEIISPASLPTAYLTFQQQPLQRCQPPIPVAGGADAVSMTFTCGEQSASPGDQQRTPEEETAVVYTVLPLRPIHRPITGSC